MSAWHVRTLDEHHPGVSFFESHAQVDWSDISKDDHGPGVRVGLVDVSGATGPLRNHAPLCRQSGRRPRRLPGLVLAGGVSNIATASSTAFADHARTRDATFYFAHGQQRRQCARPRGLPGTGEVQASASRAARGARRGPPLSITPSGDEFPRPSRSTTPATGSSGPAGIDESPHDSSILGPGPRWPAPHRPRC